MGVDEILIHLSGPSSKKDDNRFRAMALAYEDIACSNRVDVHPGTRDSGKATGAVPAHAVNPQDLFSFLDVPDKVNNRIDKQDEPAAGAIGPLLQDACTFVDDTQLAAAAVESQLWPITQSESEPRSSPLAGRGRKRRRLSGPESSARGRGEQKTIAEEAIGYEASSTASAAASSSPVHYFSSNEAPHDEDVAGAHAHTSGEERPAASEPEKGNRPSTPSQVQQPATTASSALGPPSSAKEQNERSPNLELPPDPPSVAQPATTLLAKKRPGHNVPRPLTSPKTSAAIPTRPQAPAQPLDQRNASAAAPAPAPPHSSKIIDPFHGLSTSITPPPPPIALNPSPDFSLTTSTASTTNTPDPDPDPITSTTPTPTDPTHTNLLPPTLTQLLTLPHLATKYHPRHTSRPLRPLERGHWRIDISPWLEREGGEKLAREFWQSLEAFVGRGRAGWGVGVVREVRTGPVGTGVLGTGSAGTGSDAASMHGIAAGEGEKTGSGVIRIYSFGVTVTHLYLLMYVFSKSWLRRLHAVEIGAEAAEEAKGDGAEQVKRGVEWIDAAGDVVVRM